MWSRDKGGKLGVPRVRAAGPDLSGGIRNKGRLEVYVRKGTHDGMSDRFRVIFLVVVQKMTQMGKGVNSGEVRAVCERSGPPAMPPRGAADTMHRSSFFLRPAAAMSCRRPPWIVLTELEAGRQENAYKPQSPKKSSETVVQ